MVLLLFYRVRWRSQLFNDEFDRSFVVMAITYMTPGTCATIHFSGVVLPATRLEWTILRAITAGLSCIGSNEHTDLPHTSGIETERRAAGWCAWAASSRNARPREIHLFRLFRS